MIYKYYKNGQKVTVKNSEIKAKVTDHDLLSSTVALELTEDYIDPSNGEIYPTGYKTQMLENQVLLYYIN